MSVSPCVKRLPLKARCASNSIIYLNWTPIFEWCIVGVDLRTNTKRHVLKRDWTTFPKVVDHSRSNSQHNLRGRGGPYMII